MWLFTELKRRNVLRVGAAYLVASWLLIQIVETIFLSLFGFSEQPARVVVIVLTIGFPITLIFSWLYQLTPDGLILDKDVDRFEPRIRHAGKKLDRAIIIVLTLSLGFFAVDKFLLDPARDIKLVETAIQQGRSDILLRSFGERSIVVLPFEYIGTDAEQEYFSDGISEELIDLLTKFPELRVVGRTTALSFKGRNKEVQSIAEELGVAHVLTGSIRIVGEEVRVTASLIATGADGQMWSEIYERKLDDIFAVQEEIAAKVVGELKLTILPDNSPKAYRTDPRAYALFLNARQFRLRGSPDALASAMQLYNDALAIDPSYPPAWEGLAEIHILQAAHNTGPVHENFRAARYTLKKAMELDPDFGVAIAGLGWIAMLYDRDLAEGARRLERAMELDASNPDVIHPVTHLATILGDLDAALAYTRYAIATDPMGAIGYNNLAALYLLAGRLDDAAESIEMARRQHYDAWGLEFVAGMIALMQGDAESALQAFKQERMPSYRLLGLTLAHFDLGQQDESDRFLAEFIEISGNYEPYLIAGALAWRGDLDRAFELLGTGAASHTPAQPISNFAYLYDNLVTDPRWQPFLATIGKSDAQLAEIEFNVSVPEI